MNDRCKIIVYHYVRQMKDEHYKINGMELDDFVNQISRLKKKFNMIGIQEIMDSLNHKRKIPKNSVLLTFDDGLKEHYKFVFPILRENNIQGLFFPTAKSIIEKKVLDVHKIHFILGSDINLNYLINEIKEKIQSELELLKIKSYDYYYKKYAIKDRFDSKNITFIKNLLQKGLPIKLREKLIDDFFKKYVSNDEQNFSENLYLSLKEIKEMKKNEMIFGSHGYSHLWMSTLSNNELDREIKMGEKFVEIISSKYKIMCYPYGNYNRTVIDKIRTKGFELGLTTKLGDAILTENNRFKLKRYDCEDFKC